MNGAAAPLLLICRTQLKGPHINLHQAQRGEHICLSCRRIHHHKEKASQKHKYTVLKPKQESSFRRNLSFCHSAGNDVRITKFRAAGIFYTELQRNRTFSLF